MNWLDWIIMALLVIGGFRGLRRGVVKSVLGLAGLVVGLILASQFYRTLAEYLELHYGTVSQMASSIQMHLPISSVVSGGAASQEGALIQAVEGLGLPEFITKYLAAAADSLPNLPDMASIGEALSNLIASSIVGVLCFIGIFVATMLVGWVLSWFISGLVSVTPLLVVDRLAGMVLGVAFTAVILTLVLGGLGILATLPTISFMGRALEDSTIAPHFLAFFQFLLPRVPDWLTFG